MDKLKYFFMTLNDYMIVKIIKYFFALPFLLWIRIKQFFSKNSHAKKKRRLFSTTGNISLINALTIIKQSEESDCEDYLIIESVSGKYDFWKNNYDIARKMHNFKSIKCFYHITWFEIGLYFARWTNFDEIYMLNHPKCLRPLVKLYPKSQINFFDEGFGSLINHDNFTDNIQNFKHFYSHKYINKIDNYKLPKHIADKIHPLNNKIFAEISNGIAKEYPLPINFNTSDKNILYCGIYCKCSGLPQDKFEEIQNKQIKELIEAGYKILFKPHPRDTQSHEVSKNPNVILIESVLPVEVYSWDVLAVVGMSCTTLVHLPHYFGIPGFSNVVPEALDCSQDAYIANFIRCCVDEYTPNYKELLRLDVKNTSREELKKQMYEIYQTKIKDKPLLSENNRLKEYEQKYGCK